MRYPSIRLQKVGRATEVALPLVLTDVVPMPTVRFVKIGLLKVRFSLKFFPTWLATLNVLKPSLLFTVSRKDVLAVVKNFTVLIAPTWATVSVKKVLVLFIVYVHVLVKPQTLYKC
jgi:hypothetical protein